MPDAQSQTALFEDDYLLRELGQVAHVPQVDAKSLIDNKFQAATTNTNIR